MASMIFWLTMGYLDGSLIHPETEDLETPINTDSFLILPCLILKYSFNFSEYGRLDTAERSNVLKLLLVSIGNLCYKLAKDTGRFMVQQVLLVFEKPDVEIRENDQWWRDLSRLLRNVANKNREIELLGENVLLIPLNARLEVFSEIFPNPGQRQPYPYKYVILTTDTEWHDPTNQG